MRFHFLEQDVTTFAEIGALRIAAALDAPALADLAAALADRQPDQAGSRLQGITSLRPFLASSGAIGGLAAALLGAAARPVRAVLFDKTAASNWSVP